MSSIIRHSLLLSAVGLLSVVTPAAAQTAEDHRMIVKTGDLNLRTEDGVAALHERIVAAARTACGRPDGRMLADWTRVWECQKVAIANATPRAEALVASSASAVASVAKPTPNYGE